MVLNAYPHYSAKAESYDTGWESFDSEPALAQLILNYCFIYWMLMIMVVTQKNQPHRSYWYHHRSFLGTYKQLSSFARPTRDYFILLLLSTVLAVLGLLLNNMGVIMGAIWVSPLMGPILGLSLSLVAQKRTLISRFIGLLSVSLILVILLSYILGSTFSFLGFTPEMMERTQPNVLHILLALTAGFLGGYGKIRQNIIDRALGLAITVSLLPPLCVIGITSAHGRFDLTSGALLLFGSNLASILCSSMLAFALLDLKRFHLKTLKELLIPGFLLVILSFPLFFAFEDYALERQVAHEVSRFVIHQTPEFPSITISNIEVNALSSPMIIDIFLDAPPNSLNAYQAAQLKIYLTQKLHRPISLILHVHSEPVTEIRP